MKRIILAAVAAITATVAIAQADIIDARQKAMKAAGGQSAIGAKILKGEEPFDAAKADKIFKTWAEVAAKAINAFPDNSKTGGDTAALPAIWEKKADFDARMKKWGEDAAAAKGKSKDLDSFKATFSEVAKNCGGCHENFRAKKS